MESQLPIHRVLIVEDDHATRWNLALLFQHQSVEADVAESGREAVRLLSRDDRPYCCVLLDLNIPPPDGIELARFIRDQVPGLPVVVISGRSDLTEQMARSGVGSVVRLVLMKPVDPAVLLRYVHRGNFCIRESPPGSQPPNDNREVRP